MTQMGGRGAPTDHGRSLHEWLLMTERQLDAAVLASIGSVLMHKLQLMQWCFATGGSAEIHAVEVGCCQRHSGLCRWRARHAAHQRHEQHERAEASRHAAAYRVYCGGRGARRGAS